MKPKGLLTEKEYLVIVDTMLSPSTNWGDYLNACEADYLSINQNFYPLLLKAIQNKLLPEYKTLNELLLYNPGQGYGKHNLPRLQSLEALKEFVKARAEEASREAMKPIKTLEDGSKSKFEWIREVISEVVEIVPSVQPWQITDEIKTFTEIAEAYLDDLKSGLFTAEEIVSDLQPYIDKAKQKLLDYPVKINSWEDNTPRRNGKFGLICQIKVLLQLQSFISNFGKPAPPTLPQKEQEPKPAPRAFGPELVEVVKVALMKKELLTPPTREYPSGQYIGKKMQIKALYEVLVKRGWVVPGPEEPFATWFLENFSGNITGRTLRNTASQGQEDEERDFKTLIQEKK